VDVVEGLAVRGGWDKVKGGVARVLGAAAGRCWLRGGVRPLLAARCGQAAAGCACTAAAGGTAAVLRC
jgi:hypothetical protein